MTKSESYQNYKRHRASLYASVNGQKGNLVKLRNSKILRKDEQVLVDQLIDKLTEISSTIKANDIATGVKAVQNKKIQQAAEKWVFDKNGMKWSNNDDTAGDNYGSFVEGAKWALKKFVETKPIKNA
jgi:hypothetical protein